MNQRSLRVVVAPDSFKGSAAARDIADAIADGWRSHRPHDHLQIIPMADGGEGTVDAFLTSAEGANARTSDVEGPDDRPVVAVWALLPDGTAVIEIAATSGLHLLDEARPLSAHTRGLGQAIADALDAGATRVLVGLGGSATTDGGVGALSALGARFMNAQGEGLIGGNAGLALLVEADLVGLRPLPPRGIVILSDVSSPLLGPRGAARQFGAQKGASPAQIEIMELNLARFRNALRPSRGVAELSEAAGAGAAGGSGFGLSLWGATYRSGAQAVAELIGLARAIAPADLVITGEGRYDEQTAEGKVAAHVATLAAASEVPVALVAGKIDTDPRAFRTSVELAALAGTVELSFEHPLRFARQAGALLAERQF